MAKLGKVPEGASQLEPRCSLGRDGCALPCGRRQLQLHDGFAPPHPCWVRQLEFGSVHQATDRSVVQRGPARAAFLDGGALCLFELRNAAPRDLGSIQNEVADATKDTQKPEWLEHASRLPRLGSVATLLESGVRPFVHVQPAAEEAVPRGAEARRGSAGCNGGHARRLAGQLQIFQSLWGPKDCSCPWSAA